MHYLMPLITFVVPAYNRIDKLIRSVDSIISQSYSNLELILIDDASQPTLKPYFKELKERDPRISYFINEQNKGVSFSRNLGLIHAKGEFVCFMDSDDYLDKNRLESQLEFFFESDLLVCDYFLENKHEKQIKIIPQNPEPDLLYRIVSRKLHFATLAVIWRKSFLIENSLYYKPELRNSEDYLFMVQALIKKPRIHYINQPLVVVVKSHGDSLTGQFLLRENIKNKFLSHLIVFQLTVGKISVFESFNLFKKVIGFGFYTLLPLDKSKILI